MWMDVYVSEVLIRQRLRDAQDSAARHFALRGVKPVPRAGYRSGRLRRLWQAVADLHPKQLITRVAER